MTSTTFVDKQTVIQAAWLNDVNTKTYADSSDTVAYTPAGTGAVATTVQAKLRESVSVLDFGADPTGVVDSLAAFNLALVAYGTNRTIRIPAGTYRITGTLALGINKRLIGDASESTIIRFDSTDPYCITADAYTKISGITIQKISVGSAVGIASYTPTVANGFRDGSIYDVTIIDFNVGIGSTQGLTQGLMFQNSYDNIRIYNATTAVEMGAGSNANTWTNCAFWTCGTALSLNNVATQTFTGCGFEGSTAYDAVLDAAFNIAFKTCYFEPAKGIIVNDSTVTFDTCHSTAFFDSTTQFVTYSGNSTVSINDFTDYNIGGASSFVTQWYARSGDTTGYAYKRNLRVRAGTEKADGITTPSTAAYSGIGSVSLANAATQTIVSLSGAASGRYEVFAILRASGNLVNYASVATVLWDTTGSRLIVNNGANTPISISGTDVIVTNSTGSTFTFDYGYLRIGT